MEYTSDLLWKEPYHTIMKRLGRGAENAIPRRDLITITNLKDRELRKSVETMRRAGLPIVSCNRGYFIPDNMEELRQFVRREEKRARSTFFTLKAARKALKELEQKKGERLTDG